MGWSWVALATSGNKRTRHRPCPRREVESDRIPELLGEMEQVGPCRGRGSPWGIDRPAPTEERLLVIADAASRAGVSKRLEGLTLSPRGPGALAVRFSGGQHRFSAKGIDRYVAGCGAISRVTVPDVPPSARSRAASRMGEELDRREGRNRGKEGEVVAADGASQSTLNLHGVGAGTEPYRMR